MKTLQISEKDYRDIKFESSSSLKVFSEDRRKYYKKYVSDEEYKDKETQATHMGHLVECLLWEEEEFDNKFYITTCPEPPGGMMLTFVEALYEIAFENMDENGVVQADFEDMAEEAYKVSGYKIPLKSVINKFASTNAKIYFEEITKVRKHNLKIVTADDVSNAQKVVDELRNNPITRDIVNQTNDNRYEVFNQLKVVGFKIGDMTFKAMLDWLIIDHQEKKIKPFDLKCTWSVENFFRDYYLKRRAYLQAYIYLMACCHLKDSTPEFAEYDVEVPQFIVCDSINYYSPLIYTLNNEDVMNALTGFEYRERKYPGVMDIIEDLTWAHDHQEWRISRLAAEKGGVLNIRENE